MSSDQAAADAPDPEPAAFVRLPAGAASDGRDRVMSPAARELRTRGTARSAVHGHPGFAPGDYPGRPRPADGEHRGRAVYRRPAGARPCRYRVLGGEATEVRTDRLRELRKTPGPAPRNGNENGCHALVCHERLATLTASPDCWDAGPLGVSAVLTLAPGCSPSRLQWAHSSTQASFTDSGGGAGTLCARSAFVL